MHNDDQAPRHNSRNSDNVSTEEDESLCKTHKIHNFEIFNWKKNHQYVLFLTHSGRTNGQDSDNNPDFDLWIF